MVLYFQGVEGRGEIIVSPKGRKSFNSGLDTNLECIITLHCILASKQIRVLIARSIFSDSRDGTGQPQDNDSNLGTAGDSKAAFYENLPFHGMRPPPNQVS